ncbi:MAG TPA: hypothetical protein ENG45_01005 [Candidatus Aenigmarchaeota archaeon]|nr:hypothetical protein [Candidatus Aenigmarchaeota archaeon]
MHALVKAFIGLILMIGTVAVMFYDYYQGWGLGLIPAFILVVKGILPPFIFLIGLFIFWLEIDEWKIERELAKEEEEEKKKETKRKRKKK